MNDVINTLQTVINTLQLIQVKGEENLDPLLASIRSLRALKNDLVKAMKERAEKPVEVPATEE